RRLPFKRGFNKPFQVIYNEINLDQLANFKDNSEVTPDTLRAAKLLPKTKRPIVLLGRGEVKAALKVSVHRATASAKAKIEKAGGSITIVPLKGATVESAGTKETAKCNVVAPGVISGPLQTCAARC